MFGIIYFTKNREGIQVEELQNNIIKMINNIDNIKLLEVLSKLINEYSQFYSNQKQMNEED